MLKTFRAPMIAVELAEGAESNKIPGKVQVFRTGTFYHPEYGKLDITAQSLAEIKKNFDNKVRGIDIAFDIGHQSDKEAAGWIKSLELSSDGKELWAVVDWTPTGRDVLTAKEYRYVSPDFTFDYQDNETLKKYGPVLLGAGLTNRPVIKNMEPAIELSEYVAADPEQQCVAEWMPELLKKYDREQALAIAYSKCRKGEKYSASETTKQKGDKKMDDLAQMSPEDMMKLIAELKAEVEKLKGEQAKAMEEKKMAEKKATFTKLMSEGKVCAAQQESYLSGDMVKFAELAQPVKLSEDGNSQDGDKNSKQGEDLVLELAEKKVAAKESKDLSEAIKAVLAEKPELNKQLYARGE